MVRVVRCWNWLPRDIVWSPFVEMFKTQLDTVLGSLIGLTLLEVVAWTGRSAEVPGSLNHSAMILLVPISPEATESDLLCLPAESRANQGFRVFRVFCNSKALHEVEKN